MIKNYLLAISVLFTMVACTQNKPTQATENEQESAAQTKEADSIDPQTKQANMEEVMRLKKIALRGMIILAAIVALCILFAGTLRSLTTPKVEFAEVKNGKFEICALKPSGSEWMRLSGVLVNDETLTVKEEFLNRNEGLKSMYKADDDNMAVLYITNATARFCSFAEPERQVNF